MFAYFCSTPLRVSVWCGVCKYQPQHWAHRHALAKEGCVTPLTTLLSGYADMQTRDQSPE